MRTMPRGLRVKLGRALCLGLVLGPLAACEVHFDTAPAATPATAQTAPPAATPPTAAGDPAPARPAKVIPLHVRGSGAAGDPGATAATTPTVAACLDANPPAVESCTAMAAADPSCASTTTSRQRCAAYQTDFNPKIAAAAVHCLIGLTGPQQCDPSQADNCAKGALAQACADGSVAQLCGIAASVCKSSAADCSTLVSGLNGQGKQQVAQCVAQGCTAGLTGCVQTPPLNGSGDRRPGEPCRGRAVVAAIRRSCFVLCSSCVPRVSVQNACPAQRARRDDLLSTERPHRLQDAPPPMRRKREVDRPLRSDVRSLGRILGEVLIEQEGEPLYALEERVRKLAILRRRGPSEERAARTRELVALLAELPLEQEIVIIRAFATYFRLINLAEQNHRIRRTRAYARDRHGSPQRGSILAVLESVKDAGVSADAARAAIAGLEVTLAMTAHPTEAARRTILEKLYRIARRLEMRDQCKLTPQEIADGRAAIREEVTALWQTDEVRRERPSVGDEVKNVLFYVEEILWDLMLKLPEELDRAFERVYGTRLGLVQTPLRIHSWVGGDMDGNPNVTPEVLEDSILAHQARGLRRLARAVRDLGGSLSQSDRYVKAPESLTTSIKEDAQRMPRIAEEQGPRTEGEPWRKKLRFVEARLAATLATVQGRRTMLERKESADAKLTAGYGYQKPADLAADLGLIADTLKQARCANSGERRARALFELVKARGFGIAELEMRTIADDARNGAAWIDGKGERSPGAQRLLSALERIARAQRDLGEGACRTLILSMTRDEQCVFAALKCARESGLWDSQGEFAHLDIVPLFETSAALEKSADVLRALFADPTYRKHVHARGVQEVMVGYSDSGKEIGLLAASGALRRVQMALPAIAAEAKVPLRIFHGRGESVARGGGPAQQAILALPPGAVGGRFKVTEQGEALDHKYGRPELAERTIELFIGGALLHSIGAQARPTPEEEKRFAEAYDELAEAGRVEYRSLVWEEPLFFKFFTAATPIDSISRLPIGSRPAKRGAGGVDALRAIPWVFAWTQNRMILPGWYGVGSALEKIGSRPGGADLLAEMYKRWPFFAAVVENVEMVLAKSDMGIAERYAELADPEARTVVWGKIRAEHARTAQWIKRIQGTRHLLDGNPALKRSIQLRNPYVDPMSFLQVELMRRRTGGDERVDRALLLTLNGISAGMRNTG